MLKEDEELKKRHPHQPWMWVREWEQNEIRGAGKPNMIVAWIFTGFWNLLLVTGFTKGAIHFKHLTPGKIINLAVSFLVGIGTLIWALQRTMRWRKFGKSILKLSAMPGVIGGKLQGTIFTG
ncbi:MAG: hypothetical protein GTO08_03610, partial [Deltaproteobacteria bacterium]|nr:hypothetical protein [Deltaproteobacteria bacterium]